MDAVPYNGGTRDVADAVPYDGGTRDVADAVPYDGIENGERKTKMQIKTKKATRGKGFPGVSRGFPCAGGFHHSFQFAMRGQRNKAESAKT